jgi:hypothetical protein
MPVHHKHTSDIDDVLRDNAKLEKDNTKLIEQYRMMARDSAKAKKQSRSGLRQMAQAAAAAVTGYVSVQAAIQAVTKSIKDKMEMEKRAAGHAISLSGAQQEAIINLGDVTDKVMNKFFSDVDKVAANKKIPQNIAIQAASAGLSASRGDRAGTLAALRIAGVVSSNNPEGIAGMTEALLDTRKITGDLRAATNFGFMMAMQSQARGTSLTQIADFGVPRAGAVHSFGGSAGEAGALITGLSQAMMDKSMRRSGTTAIALASQLADFLPEKDRLGFKNGRPFVERPATGLTSTRERLEFLRREENEMLSREFYAQASFEQGAKGSIPSLLGIEGFGDKAYKDYAGALKTFPTLEEGVAMGERKLAQMQRTFSQGMGGVSRGHQSAVEQHAISVQGMELARGDIYSKDRLMVQLEAMGVPWNQRFATGVEYHINPRSKRDFYERSIRGYADWAGGTAMTPSHAGPIPDRPGDPPAHRETIRIAEDHLEDLATRLKSIDQQLRARRREAQRTPAAVGAALHQHGE